MPEWTWYGAPIYGFRDERGRFASERDIIGFSRGAIGSRASDVRALSESLEEGLGVGTWQASMREQIKQSLIEQACLAAGGRDQMTPQDWGTVGGLVAKQYRYLDEFAAKIAAGEFSTKQIAAYAEMYMRSSGEAFERIRARVRGLPTMPVYPKDGNTRCLTNCGCHWEYEWDRTNQVWRCWWNMNPALENCEDCQDNAARWSESDPLIIEPETAKALKGGFITTEEGNVIFIGGPSQGAGGGTSGEGNVAERAASFILDHEVGEKPPQDVMDYVDNDVVLDPGQSLGDWALDTLASKRSNRLLSQGMRQDVLEADDRILLQSMPREVWRRDRSIHVVPSESMPSPDRISLEREWGISRHAIAPVEVVGLWQQRPGGFDIIISNSAPNKREVFWHEFSHTIPQHIIRNMIGPVGESETAGEYHDRFASVMAGSKGLQKPLSLEQKSRFVTVDDQVIFIGGPSQGSGGASGGASTASISKPDSEQIEAWQEEIENTWEEGPRQGNAYVATREAQMAGMKAAAITEDGELKGIASISTPTKRTNFLTGEEEWSSNSMSIYHLATKERGYGRSMMEMMIAHAAEHDWEIAWNATATSNGFYRAIGFEPKFGKTYIIEPEEARAWMQSQKSLRVGPEDPSYQAEPESGVFTAPKTEQEDDQ